MASTLEEHAATVEEEIVSCWQGTKNVSRRIFMVIFLEESWKIVNESESVSHDQSVEECHLVCQTE